MEARSCRMEVGWQTTRVSPTALRFRLDRSERAFGTFPPVHGLIEQSGAGSGQYEARSMCASAAEGSAIAIRTTPSSALRNTDPSRSRSAESIRRVYSFASRFGQPASFRGGEHGTRA